MPGQDGLVHVSELSNKRVNRPEDVVKMGDEIWVKCIGVDDKGRVKLSRKAAMEERGELPASGTDGEGEARPSSERPPRGERPERGERGDRGERPERSERSDRPERGERRERPERGGGETSRPKPEPEGDRSARGSKQGSPEDKARAASAAEPGRIYRAKVVSIKDFGAFVEFVPGAEGLVHVSELANFRVKKVEDIVQIGDEITVKCLGVDEKGRVRLSRKAAMEERDQQAAGAPAPAAESTAPADTTPAEPPTAA
jgi:predicted RNA-binding protein with RPS1 domain